MLRYIIMSTKLIKAILNDAPLETIEKLIVNNDIGFVDSKGNTALLYACENEMSDVALLLIRTGKSK